MINYEQDDNGLVTLTIDMPDRSANVWNQASMDAFSEALERAAADESCTGIIIASAKKVFLAGADLDALKAMAFGDKDPVALNATVGALSVLLRRLETCGKTVVAAIEGAALGGGFELALACHHRVVADSPRLQLGLPESQLGLLPGAGGTQRLPRLIGIQASMPLLLEGKQLTPDKALKAGIIDQVVPRGEVVAAAKAWALANPEATQPWDDKRFKVPGGGLDDPKTLSTFMVATALLNAKTHGNYPAGKAILSCMFEGLRTTLDAGLLIEKRYFLKLLLDPTAGAMIRTMFLSLQDANKLVRRPAGIERRAPKKLGVLGSGLMGSGIAFVAAKKGMEVVVLDVDAEKAAGAIAYASKRLDKAISRGRSTEEKKAATLARITATADYAALDGCDLVIEAVFEDRDVKAKVTAAADAVLGDSAVFGSNTSTLPITGLAKASSRPENFIGLHFFSPVEKMPLVEVIRAEKTSDQTLAWALDAVQALGKTPIVVNDARGFYTSRVFGTYITEGMAMLQEGIAPALIENAGKMSGMPMPPLGLADEVGLGLMYQVGIQTKKDLGDAAPVNPSTPVLEKLVTEFDRSGKRSGRGFYAYDDAGRQLWDGLAESFPAKADQPTADDLIERFLYTQALEAARCMDQGVVQAKEDADVGAILGWGFAPYTGGPLSYIDRIGAKAFVERADALAEAHGKRFEPPALLRTMAADGTAFYG
ncbi:MAG: enoyl-CoA hydratase/isomerase family protein [Proteobacteria bacterium]|nr:enoyl-CoA hydratase/isomerase family protein [Pseudomonadota bacterium]